ncbi:MAG TPA: DMT family transporter [Rhizobacter sp.]
MSDAGSGPAPGRPKPDDAPRGQARSDWGARYPASLLFTVCVLVWSTTWYAITFQIGDSTPEFGVALRFMLAGTCVLAWRAARGERLTFPPRAHAWFALQGLFLYGVSYICVYHAERYLPSGVVAVGYSASPLAGGIGAAWLFGSPLTRRFLLGGVLGLAGVALIFWPEFGKARTGGNTSLGAVFTVGSVLLSTVGSLLASRNGARGLTMWPSLGFGMLYGGAAVLLIALASGQSLVWPTAPSWWAALLYLALAGSVLSFACYLTLLERLGAGPAGTIGVMTPILALVVSTLFENYRPDLLAGAGVLLAVIGNVLILRKAPLRVASRAAE